MVRHISVFFFKENIDEADQAMVINTFRAMETKLDYVADYHVGEDCMERPLKGLPGLPKFGHFAQVIDFKTMEAAAAYGTHPAHLEAAKAADPYIEKVVGIDFLL